jgi:integrase
MINEVINEGMLGKSQSYKRNVLKFIKLTFQYAVDQGYLALNPTPRMKFKVGDKIKRVLTSNQAAKLLNSAKFDSDWYPHWAMALYTGMRSGELYALTWDKVNFESRQIRVDCSWNSKDGFKSTKSGDERIVEIAPSLLQVLKELKLELGSSSTFVLPRMRAWDKGDQARELKKYLIGISVPPVRFHDLRATWATIMLSQGIPPIKVMKMGGWKDLKTMQIYMRMAGIDIQGVTDNLCLHNPASGTVSHLKVASFEHFPKVIR